MGLFSNKNAQSSFNFWHNVPEPAYGYKRGNLSCYLFFIDDHEDRDKILEQRLYAIDNQKRMFKIMLEKEIYDKTPDYYSEEALFAQLDFYRGVSKEVFQKLLIGAVVIGGGTLGIFTLLKIDSIFGSMISLFLSLGYMFIFMSKGFDSILRKRRKMFRDTLISLYTEPKLEEMLDIQDAYTKRRNEELQEMRDKAKMMRENPPVEIEEEKDQFEEMEVVESNEEDVEVEDSIEENMVEEMEDDLFDDDEIVEDDMQIEDDLEIEEDKA